MIIGKIYRLQNNSYLVTFKDADPKCQRLECVKKEKVK